MCGRAGGKTCTASSIKIVAKVGASIKAKMNLQ